MLRVLLLAATLALLAGCATPSYRYYGERYYVDERYPVEETRYVTTGGYVSEPDYPYWVDYPAYYSLFWNINRLYSLSKGLQPSSRSTFAGNFDAPLPLSFESPQLRYYA